MSDKAKPTIAERVNHIKEAWYDGRPTYGLITKAPQTSKKAGIPVITWSPGNEAKLAIEKGYEGVIVGLDTTVIVG
uniref:GP-PDE domain-containing protein n=1 Tax=Kwoniella pini CBS 10737 TaxID=1296096 RepID=A0A1B9I8Y6_9TREE|nr:uncharacterized protein I206_02649 [Kwoniella pini CBS 10737]OCF51933.1 hypothetical protein I206_02649 [Kwoniella pini CBS 10737]